MEEIWKNTKYDFFQVSNLGNVRSLDRHQINRDGKTYFYKGHILKQTKTKDRDGSMNGYLVVNIRQQGKSNLEFVHRLVAEAFLENINNLECVNHKDGNKQNNNIDNLEWCTYLDNNVHALKKGLRHSRGNKIKQLDKNGNIINIYNSTCEASRITNINRSLISHCINGRTKNAGGFYWERV